MALTFNDTFYLSNNADVLQAVGRGTFASALQHYNLFGARELRSPNSTFNAREYILQNDDLVRAFQNGTLLNPFQHYLSFGVAENRAPSAALQGFSATAYLAANPDVAAAVGAGKAFASAMQHYLLFGQGEGRAALNAAGQPLTVNQGTTFTLTTNVDNVAGTANNDTINGLIGTNATLTAADVVAGGAGVDTLAVTYANNGGNLDAFGGALVTDVEVISVRNTNTAGGNAATVAAPTGLTGVVATGAGDVTVTALPAGATFTANGTTGGVFKITHVDAATTASVTTTGATTGNITLAGAGLTSATITANGSASTVASAISAVTGLKTWNISAASNLTLTNGIDTAGTTGTLNVSGAAAAVKLGTLDTDFTTINAGGLTAGGISAVMSGTAAVTLTGGAGNDTITTGVESTGKVDAGAGTGDRLVIAATGHLTVASGARFTNFEVAQVNDGVDADISRLTGITGIRLNDGAGTTAINGMSAAQAGAITVAGANDAITFGITGAANVGQIDTLSLTLDDGETADAAFAFGKLTATGVEIININALNESATITSFANLGALTNLNITGSKAVTVTALTDVALQVNTKIDASAATGAFTIDASAVATGNNGLAVIGGSANDVVTGTTYNDALTGGAGADSLRGVAGNDTLSGGDGADTINGGVGVDSMTGGAGNDVFRFTAVTKGEVDRITDFDAATDKFSFNNTANVINGATFTAVTATVATTQTIATAADTAGVFAGITSLGTASSNTTIQAAVVVVSAGAAAGTYLYINDQADAGVQAANDTLLNITGVTGTITAANFVFVTGAV